MNPLAVGAVAGTVAVMAAPAAFVLLLAPASSQGACAPGGTGGAATELAANEVPGDLMPLYHDAEDRYGVPWNVLAAINRVETDFGRNMAVSSAGAVGWMQFMPATWTLYGVDGDGDGRRDPENPRDAIPAAARYLKASGAPADLRGAVFAYNHAGWYVDDVLALAGRYGTNPVVGDAVLDCGGDLAGGTELPVGPRWLEPVPGMPGEQCDSRIIPDVVALIRRYRVTVTDCYATSGHAADGEHPLGLGVDLVPGPGGTWDDIDRLARDVGWTRACGASGVRPACPLKRWVRFVGYDGYPGHGRGNHAHISWQHGPDKPASTVTVFSGGTT